MRENLRDTSPGFLVEGPSQDVVNEPRALRLVEVHQTPKRDSVGEEPDRVIRNYSYRRTAWKAEQAALAPEEKSGEQPPTPPSLEDLANEHGLTYEKTALIPFLELRETAIGKYPIDCINPYRS